MSNSSVPEMTFSNLKFSDIRISRALFSFILACFLLPFITVSCGTQQFKLNGLQVVGGADLDPSSAGDEMAADLGVATTVLIALAGLVLTYFGMRYLSLGILGLLATLLLWSYRLRLNADVASSNASNDAVISAVISVRYEPGYWLALLLFLGVTGLNAFVFWQNRTSLIKAKHPLNNHLIVEDVLEQTVSEMKPQESSTDH